MNPEASRIVWETAIVVLIVAVTRWLLDGKGVKTRKTIDSTHVYGVKRRVKITGFAGAGLFALLLVAFLRESFSPRGLWLDAIPLFFILLGIWLAIGSVTTNESGIAKKTLWSTRALQWNEVSAIRFYERQNYIELRGKNRKLTVDVRFIALKQLLDDIVSHTKLQVETK